MPDPIYPASLTAGRRFPSRWGNDARDRIEDAHAFAIGTYNGTLGHLLGGDLSSDGTQITVAPIERCLVKGVDNKPVRVWTSAPTNLALPTPSGSPGSYVVTWWYVYAKAGVSGAIDFEINTTPPDPSLTWKSGYPEIRRYLGCFVTTASGAARPFRKRGRRYEYCSPTVADRKLGDAANSGASMDDGDVLGLGGGSDNIAVLKAYAFVPPHAAAVDLALRLYANAGPRRAGVNAYHTDAFYESITPAPLWLPALAVAAETDGYGFARGIVRAGWYTIVDPLGVNSYSGPSVTAAISGGTSSDRLSTFVMGFEE